LYKSLLIKGSFSFSESLQTVSHIAFF